MPARNELPSTLQRSPAKARRTWKEAHDHAAQEYGDGERAHRTAYAALKHSFEKIGGRWVAKRSKGPSDPRAKKPTAAARRGEGRTFGGIDYYGSTKAELYERARKAHVKGRSSMSKEQLADAVARREH